MSTNEPAWLAAARPLVGLKEIVGSRHEPKVVQFFADAGHSWVKDDETAWCAAFANAMLKRAGVEGTNSLAARSFLQWGQKLTTPRVGCIVVFKRGTSSWQGHVGFYVGETKTHIRVLGGNQGNAVSIASYNKKSLLGYRWPAAVPAERPAEAPPAVNVMDGKRRVEVEVVQRRLRQLGYHEVGELDGRWGGRTAAGVAAFKNDRHLAGPAEINAELLTALDAAEASGWSRPIAAARKTATPAELETKLPEVGEAKKAQRVGFWTSISGGASAVVAAIVAKLGDAVEWIAPLKTLAGDVPWFVWVGGAIAGSIAIYYASRKAGDAAEAATAAFNQGART